MSMQTDDNVEQIRTIPTRKPSTRRRRRKRKSKKKTETPTTVEQIGDDVVTTTAATKALFGASDNANDIAVLLDDDVLTGGVPMPPMDEAMEEQDDLMDRLDAVMGFQTSAGKPLARPARNDFVTKSKLASVSPETVYANRDPFEKVVSTGTRPANARAEYGQLHRRLANIEDSDEPLALYGAGDWAREQLTQLRPHLRGAAAIAAPLEEPDLFVVRGMESSEPNPEVSALEGRRRLVMAQLANVETALHRWSARSFFAGNTFNQADALRVRNQNAYTADLMAADYFVDRRQVTLLKPEREVRRLNDLWRGLLKEELLRVREAYQADTNRALTIGGLTEADADGLTANFMLTVVDPVLQRHLEVISTATFEDRPLLESTLELYFANYLSRAIVDMARRDNPDAFERTQNAAFRGFDENLDDSGIMLTYLADTLERYATPKFLAWFQAWEAAAKANITLAGMLTGKRVAQLRRYISSIISGREELAKRATVDRIARKRQATMVGRADSNRTHVSSTLLDEDSVKRRRRDTVSASAPLFFQLYVPMTEAQARGGYRELLINTISLVRARYVAEPSEAVFEPFSGQLRTRSTHLAGQVPERRGDSGGSQATAAAFRGYLEQAMRDERDFTVAELTSGSLLRPAQILTHPAADWPDLLEQVAQEVRSNFESGIVPLDTDRQLSAQETAAIDARRVTVIRRVEVRLEALREQLNAYSGGALDGGVQRGPVIRHSPNDPESARSSELGDTWSPFDLSYPLDRDLTGRAISDLYDAVRLGAESYDPDQDHADAETIRRALDRNHASKLLKRQRSELEYQLDKVLSPYITVPRSEVRDWQDPGDVVFRVEIKPSPLLEARILASDGNDAELSEMERDSMRWLTNQQFEVRWLFTPQFAEYGDEREIKRRVMGVGETNDALQVFARHWGDDTTQSTGLDDQAASADGRSKDAVQLSKLRSALARSGVYRAEVRRVTATQPVVVYGNSQVIYRSEFRAALSLSARCERDGARFFPMPSGMSAAHDNCSWSEQLHDKTQMQLLERLSTLVYSGPVAHKELIDRQAQGEQRGYNTLAAEAERLGLAAPPPTLPPWGLSTPENLAQVAMTYDATKEQDLFSFESILDQFVARMAAVARVAFSGYTIGRPGRTRGIPRLQTMSDADVFIFLSSTQFSVVMARAVARAHARMVAEHANAVSFGSQPNANAPVSKPELTEAVLRRMLMVAGYTGVRRDSSAQELYKNAADQMIGTRAWFNGASGIFEMLASHFSNKVHTVAAPYSSFVDSHQTLEPASVIDGIAMADSDTWLRKRGVAGGIDLAGQIGTTNGIDNYSLGSGHEQISELPISRILLYLSMPWWRVLATKRESAFFARVGRHFDSFARDYFEMRRKDMLLPHTHLNVGFAPGDTNTLPLHLRESTFGSIDAVFQHLNNDQFFEAGLDLSSLTIDNVQHFMQGDHFRKTPAKQRRNETMFFDIVSRNELANLLRKMLPQNVPLHEVGNGNRISKLGRFIDDRRSVADMAGMRANPRIVNGARMFAANTRSQFAAPQWRGTHTAITNQPLPMRVRFIDLGVGGLPDNVPSRVVVTRHGSYSPKRLYDVRGLRDFVRDKISIYNKTAASVGADVMLTAANKSELMAQQALIVRTVVLIFNFFTLVAPARASFINAAEIVHKIESGEFDRLHFELPRDPTIDF